MPASVDRAYMRLTESRVSIKFVTFKNGSRGTYQLEVPNQVRIGERRDKGTRGTVDVDVNRKSFSRVFLAKKSVDFLHILILAGICRSENRTDKDRVFVD